jgi:dolichol-phosphate mannosyltransferase
MKEKRDSVIILPTFNEIGNIEITLKKIENLNNKFDVIVVDDNSPDGTGSYVQDSINSKKFNINITLIRRKGKEGLGTAYIEGFKKSLELKYNFIFQLDCDGSHDPNKLEDLLNELKNNNTDIVVGSRYIKGITVINWPLSRLLLSIFANYYVKIITGLNVNDSTGGFNGYSYNALNSIMKNNIYFKGYAFQIQMKFIGYKLGYRIKEIPIIFKDREIGESKMSFKISGEAFLGIIYMKFISLFKSFKS